MLIKELELKIKSLQESLKNAKNETLRWYRHKWFKRFYKIPALVATEDVDIDSLAYLINVPDKHLLIVQLEKKITLIEAQIASLSSKLHELQKRFGDFLLELETLSTRNILYNSYYISDGKFKFKINDGGSEDVCPFTEIIIASHENPMDPTEKFQYWNLCDVEQLWKCWDIVNVAFLLKNDLTRVNKLKKDKYSENSDRILKTLLQKLPQELQPLKVLFKIPKHARVAYFLRKYFAIDATNIQAKTDLENELYSSVKDLYRKRAMVEVRKERGFEDLHTEHKQLLIEQQSYILLLSEYYKFAGNTTEEQSEKLVRFRTKLKDNIKKALESKQENDKTLKEEAAKNKKRKRKLRYLEEKKRAELLISLSMEQIQFLFEGFKKNIIKIVTSSNSINYSPFSLIVYVLGILYFGFVYSLISSVTSIAQLMMLGGNGLAIAGGGLFIYHAVAANAAIIPEIEAYKELEKQIEDLPDSEQLFLIEEDKFWSSLPKLDFTSDIANVNSSYFYDKYRAIIESAQDVYKNITKMFTVFVKDTTSPWEEKFLSAAKVAAGVVLVIAVFLTTIFALSGVPGPLLLFVFAPALSIGIIVASIVTVAKLNFEKLKNPDAVRIINSFVDLSYKPVEILLLGFEKLLKPVNATVAMLRKSANGRSPTKRNLVIGGLTIALATSLAVIFGVGLALIAPGISGVAVVSSVLLGAHIGFKAGVLATEFVDVHFYNKPKARILRLEKSIIAILKIAEDDQKRPIISDFKERFPEFAAGLIELLQKRAESLHKNIEETIKELPQLLAKPSIPATGKKPAKTAEQQVQAEIDEIEEEIGVLQNHWNNLLANFITFDDKVNHEEKHNKLLSLALSIDNLLFYEYDIAKAEYKNLIRSGKGKDKNKDPLDIKHAVIFSNYRKSSEFFVSEPSFELPTVNHHKERAQIDKTHELAVKFRESYKATL